MMANDPQIQLSEDVGEKIASGLPTATLVMPQNIDIAKSLATFTIVYSNSGQVLFSNALLNNQTPTLPSGVFADAQKRQLRFTWQPEPGVRSAAVMTHYAGKDNGFVLVGRSLREVEVREHELLQEVVIGWLVTLIVLYAIIFAVIEFNSKFRKL